MITMAPSLIGVCQQLGRYWSARTLLAGGLIFAEELDATPGHIYAAPLPDQGARAAGAACSLTVGPGAGQQAAEPFEVIPVNVRIEAATVNAAMLLAADLHAVLKPDQRIADFAAENGGVIGAPLLGPGSEVAMWRFIRADIIAPAQALTIAASEASAAGGQAAVTMTVAFYVIPVTVFSAFELYGDDGIFTELANVSVNMTDLRLRSQDDPENDVAMTTLDLASRTIQELHDDIDALAGWAVSPVDAKWASVSASAMLMTAQVGTFVDVQGVSKQISLLAAQG